MNRGSGSASLCCTKKNRGGESLLRYSGKNKSPNFVSMASGGPVIYLSVIRCGAQGIIQ